MLLILNVVPCGSRPNRLIAAFISLPTFPLGVDPVRLQRVVAAMSRFGLLPQGTTFNISSMISGG